jgi:uncharacterized membrane protein
MTSIFAHLFLFESVSILFKDDHSNTLYSINLSDSKGTKLNEKNVIKFPMTLVLSGKAAYSNKIIVGKNGEKEKYYSSEIDNLHNVNKVNNIMIGPI